MVAKEAFYWQKQFCDTGTCLNTFQQAWPEMTQASRMTFVDFIRHVVLCIFKLLIVLLALKKEADHYNVLMYTMILCKYKEFIE